MKKIFLFCVLSVLSLTSCDELEKYKENSVKSDSVEHMEVVTEGMVGRRHYLLDISKVNYKEHSYLLFDGDDHMNGVIHDPDCSCHNNE